MTYYSLPTTDDSATTYSCTPVEIDGSGRRTLSVNFFSVEVDQQVDVNCTPDPRALFRLHQHPHSAMEGGGMRGIRYPAVDDKRTR